MSNNISHLSSFKSVSDKFNLEPSGVLRKVIKNTSISDHLRERVSNIETNISFFFNKNVEGFGNKLLIIKTLEEIKLVLNDLEDINTLGVKILKSSKEIRDIPSFNEELIQESVLYLNQLEKDLETIQLEAIAVEFFAKENHCEGAVYELLRSFIHSLFQSITEKINTSIFYGGKFLKEQQVEYQSIINHTNEKLQKLEEELKEFQSDYQPIFKLVEQLEKMKADESILLNSLMKGKQLHELSNEELTSFMTDEEYIQINKDIEFITIKLDKLLKDNDILLSDVEEKREWFTDVRIDFEETLSEATRKLNIGSITRADLKKIGAEPLKIHDQKSNSILDGIYISANGFKDVLRKSNGQVGSIKIGKAIDIPCIAFPKGEDNKELFDSLDNLGLFGESENRKYLMTKIEYEDKILFCLEDDYEKLDSIVSDKLSSGVSEEDLNIEYSYSDFTDSSDGGTVILTSGNAGVYEMQKREILSFLLKGMNVIAANFSGYGESTGTSSGKNFNSNMEAIYQHLQSTHPTHDSKIMLKALCMSGGPATYLASRHPKVNLFLDQSYANFADLVAYQIEVQINEIGDKAGKIGMGKLNFLFNEKGIKFLAQIIAKIISPSWSIKNEIKKVEGAVGILLTEDDDLRELDEKEVCSNYKAVIQGGNEKVMLMEIPGEHATNWYEEVAGRVGIDRFLNRFKLAGKFL